MPRWDSARAMTPHVPSREDATGVERPSMRLPQGREARGERAPACPDQTATRRWGPVVSTAEVGAEFVGRVTFICKLSCGTR